MLDPSTGFTAHSINGASFDIIAGMRTLPAAAFAPADADFDGYVIVDFDAFDEWREEDEVLVGHARDPFKTVDTRRSSRRVEVEIGGTVVADSTRSVMLFETYLPTRYYLPREDVRMELLVPTDTASVCAYKGQARYWSAHVNDTVVADVAWSYEDPAQLRHVGRGHDLLLQRTGGPARRRRPTGTSTQPVVQLMPALQPSPPAGGNHHPAWRPGSRSDRNRW